MSLEEEWEARIKEALKDFVGQPNTPAVRRKVAKTIQTCLFGRPLPDEVFVDDLLTDETQELP